jgi:hypothetical protein
MTPFLFMIPHIISDLTERFHEYLRGVNFKRGEIQILTGSCTIGGHIKLRQTSNLYKVKIQKYTLCKFGFLQIRL